MKALRNRRGVCEIAGALRNRGGSAKSRGICKIYITISQIPRDFADPPAISQTPRDFADTPSISQTPFDFAEPSNNIFDFQQINYFSNYINKFTFPISIELSIDKSCHKPQETH